MNIKCNVIVSPPQAGGSSVLLLPRLSPPLVRHTATLPPLKTDDHSLCVYEGKEAEKEPTKVLAKITMPKVRFYGIYTIERCFCNERSFYKKNCFDKITI